MTTDKKNPETGSYSWHLLAIAAATLLSIIVIVYDLRAGRFIIFQNLLYLPIVLACVYYLKKGFVFSVLLAFSYFVLIIGHTADFALIREALISAVISSIIAGVVTFISLERKRALQVLQKSEKKYRLIFENAGEGILILEAEGEDRGKIVAANHAVVAMHGYPLEELLTMKISDIDTLESAASAPERFERILRGERISGEVVHVRKDGTKFPLEIEARLFDFGKKKYILTMERDITDRKRVEDALRESEEKFRAIFHTQQLGLLIVDLQTHAIADANAAAISLIGLPRADVIGKICHAFVCPAECGACPITDLGQTIDNSERILIAAGGERIPILKSVEPITLAGHAYLIESFADLRERKRMENELHKLNEQLEQKVKEKTRQLVDAHAELVRKEKLVMLGTIAAGMGNELRNPLGVIKNAAYFLKTVMPDADETVKEYLNIIENEIDNSERIISGLTDSVRTRTPEKIPVTVGELMDKSLGRCRIPENIHVQTDIPDTLPEVSVDPFQMGEVLLNLIMNAVQAMPGGGALKISACLAQSSGLHASSSGVKPGTDFIEISVKDSGKGISPENMGNLFQPLFTTKARGIGLGLVVCKNLMEANGGRIEVESELGKGTVFRLGLPVNGRGM